MQRLVPKICKHGSYSYKSTTKYRQDARTDDHHVPCEWKWKRGGAAETLSALRPSFSVFLSSARVFQVMIKGDILQYSSVHGHFFLIGGHA